MTAATLETVFTVIQRQLILPRHLHAADSVTRMTPARPYLAITGSNSETSYTRTAAFIANVCWENLLAVEARDAWKDFWMLYIAELDVSNQVQLNYMHAALRMP